LRDIAREFYTAGLHTLRLSVDDKEIDTYQFRVEKDRTAGLQYGIAQADKLILILAAVFAAILSYLAIDQLDTFGTVSDYALAFLGGFGLNSTTSGFSAVLSRFGATPQSTSATRQ
jgi:hypothetical protein